MECADTLTLTKTILKLERFKLVCTQADMTNLKDRMQKRDIFDICGRERANTKWKYFKLTKLTVYASLLKDLPMICKDTVFLT